MNPMAVRASIRFSALRDRVPAMLLAAVLLLGDGSEAAVPTPRGGSLEPGTPRERVRLAARPSRTDAIAEEFGLLYVDRYFYIDNAGLRRVHAVINGHPFKLTTDPAEVARGANTYLISDTGETTIDMGRYMIPAPETDTTLNRMSVEAEGPPGADAFIVIADQYVTDSVDYVLDLAPIPSEAGVLQNYPNPFNSATVIEYQIPASLRGGVDLTIAVYDILGRRVRTLMEDRRYPGSFTIRWDGTNDNGESVPSGAYFYRMAGGSLLETRKLMIVR
jgi:hypothetical protein